MRTYFFLLLLSTLCSFVITRWLARVAAARGWTRSEDSNGTAIPRLGGVSVFVSTLLMLLLLFLWDNQVAERVAGQLVLGLALAGAAAAVFLVGLYDDLRGARPWQKLLAQCGAGVALFIAGFRVEVLTNPLTHEPFQLGWLSFPLSLLWLVAISNAFNLIDGLDGLAAGVGLTSTLALFFLASLQSHSLAAVVAVAIAGSLLGFLPHNFNPARIYLGDSGSLTIGMVLAALSIETSQKGPVLVALTIPLLIFGLPLLDVSVTTLRRALAGHPIFKRDEEHLHHRLIKTGLTPRVSVLVLYGVAALFALASLLVVNYRGAIAPLIALLCGLLAWIVVRQMQYPEFAALDSHVRGEWRAQKAALRSQILMQKELPTLTAASSVEEIWTVACRLFDALGFQSAVLELSPAHGSTLCWEQTGADAPGSQPKSGPEWMLTIPLRPAGQALGTLRLAHTAPAGPLKFRVVQVIDFFSGAFAAALARCSPARESGHRTITAAAN
jgi:UDP-GlcNAc:undecaprenyl-phosphate GlcNAc-1-phosphate transferase